MSFWLPENVDFHNNDLFEVVRDTTEDLVEEVRSSDQHRHYFARVVHSRVRPLFPSTRSYAHNFKQNSTYTTSRKPRRRRMRGGVEEGTYPKSKRTVLISLAFEHTSSAIPQVQLLDTFVHPKTGRRSLCFRITYRSMDRSLTNEEVDRLQDTVRRSITHRLNVKLR